MNDSNSVVTSTEEQDALWYSLQCGLKDSIDIEQTLPILKSSKRIRFYYFLGILLAIISSIITEGADSSSNKFNFVLETSVNRNLHRYVVSVIGKILGTVSNLIMYVSQYISILE